MIALVPVIGVIILNMIIGYFIAPYLNDTTIVLWFFYSMITGGIAGVIGIRMWLS